MANQITHKEVTFHTGDLIKVHLLIKEGDKTRPQIFEGIVIAIKANDDPTFIVRKIASGQIGVEKIFPINAPVISKIEVKRTASVKQAKLYYLRDRIGKQATKLKATKRK